MGRGDRIAGAVIPGMSRRAGQAAGLAVCGLESGFGTGQQWTGHPPFGSDPFLSVVSKNEGGEAPLSRDEILGRFLRFERPGNLLAFEHDERVGRVNDIVAKGSGEHWERAQTAIHYRLKSRLHGILRVLFNGVWRPKRLRPGGPQQYLVVKTAVARNPGTRSTVPEIGSGSVSELCGKSNDFIGRGPGG